MQLFPYTCTHCRKVEGQCCPPLRQMRVRACVCVCMCARVRACVRACLCLSLCLSVHVCAKKETRNQDSNSRPGNVQRDGRKFFGHFKRHFGSKISSESLRQDHIYRMTLTFATKLSLITFTVRERVSPQYAIVLPTSTLRKRARLFRV